MDLEVTVQTLIYDSNTKGYTVVTEEDELKAWTQGTIASPHDPHQNVRDVTRPDPDGVSVSQNEAPKSEGA